MSVVNGSLSAAGHQFGGCCQPARSSCGLHPRAFGDRGHHGRVVGMLECLCARQRIIEHTFDYRGDPDTDTGSTSQAVDKAATVDNLGGSLTWWTTRRHSSSKTAFFRI